MRWLAILAITSSSLLGQSFTKSKMFIEEDYKLRIRNVKIDFQDSALVVTGKKASALRVPYTEITGIEYEKTKHRRWKTAVLLTGFALMSKGKKHWFTVLQGEQETVFRLDKSNFAKILKAAESRTGKKIQMIATRD